MAGRLGLLRLLSVSFVNGDGCGGNILALSSDSRCLLIRLVFIDCGAALATGTLVSCGDSLPVDATSSRTSMARMEGVDSATS